MKKKSELDLWKNGKTECFAVTSYKWVTDDSLNWDREEYEYEVFFNVEEANVLFDEIVEENKDFCEAGYRFFVQITKINTTDREGRIIDIPVSERETISSEDELFEEFMPCSEEGNVRTEVIDTVIPDDGVVVTSYMGVWRSASWALRRSYGDLYPDRGEYHHSDDVYFLSELSPSREDYDLLQFIIEQLEMTRDEMSVYMDEEELDMLYGEGEADE
jgi:NADH:ubiquinone oxidoreductase subunit C